MYSHKAFTVSEVLLTLAIIGVIAALTLPSLLKSYEKNTWTTGYKAGINIISQITKTIMSENNNTLVGKWGAGGDDQSVYDLYSPYFKTVRTCENINPKGSCFNSVYTLMDNAINAAVNGVYSVILTNGMSLSFYNPVGPVDYILIYLDINGAKSPNVLGKDLHIIKVSINSDPVKPYLVDVAENAILIGCPSDLMSAGTTCGVRIMRNDYGEDY
ncbi:MAG TPA: type II secretion system protein [Candidatus Gastranaerophilales bacterium]|nr:type II secretion system protein [Candidatus Gastranaerophilales bacterium]